MPKRKALPARPTPFLTEDGLTQLVLDGLRSKATPSAADYDLARKIIKAREKSGAKKDLTEALRGTLSQRLLDRLNGEKRIPANVLMVAVKLLGDSNVKCQAQPVSPEERNRALGASLEGIDLPFPIVGPAEGSTGEH